MPETGLSPIVTVKGKIWCAGAQHVPRGMGCSSQHAVKEVPRPEMIESRCHLMRQKNAKSNLLHLRVRTCTCLGTESWTSVNWRFQPKTFQNNSMGYLLFFYWCRTSYPINTYFEDGWEAATPFLFADPSAKHSFRCPSLRILKWHCQI